MLKGSFVALITPMDPQGRVDYEALSDLIEFHITNGTDGLIILGTTGESAVFSVEEAVKVVSFAVTKANKRIPIIAGNGANCTQKAIELTQAMNHLDLEAMLCVTPYYNKPSPEGLKAHFIKIAESTEIPQILYNVPSRTGVDMQPETIAELASHPNIIGVKEATGDLSRLHLLRALCGENFALLSGDDETSMEFLLQGGDGVMSVVANVAPKQMKELVETSLEKNAERANVINHQLSLLHKDLFIEANPIPVKWAMHRIGLISSAMLRLPLTELSEKYHIKIATALEVAGLEVHS